MRCATRSGRNISELVEEYHTYTEAIGACLEEEVGLGAQDIPMELIYIVAAFDDNVGESTRLEVSTGELSV